MNIPARSVSGFTLVELAIVMTIVGLLIGGILKGNELLTNARVGRVIRDYHSVTAAVAAFRDSYFQWPGDMANATARLEGCGAPGSFCSNGDANGRVGVLSAQLDRNHALAGGAARETVQFWKHLALAGLVTGIVPNADPATPQYGQTHLAAPFNGGYSVILTNVLSGQSAEGHWLRLERAMTENRVDYGPGANVVSPSIAARIDRKIDDGAPEAGIFRAESTGSGCDTGGAADSQYNETVTSNNCFLFFLIQ